MPSPLRVDAPLLSCKCCTWTYHLLTLSPCSSTAQIQSKNTLLFQLLYIAPSYIKSKTTSHDHDNHIYFRFNHWRENTLLVESTAGTLVENVNINNCLLMQCLTLSVYSFHPILEKGGVTGRYVISYGVQ